MPFEDARNHFIDMLQSIEWIEHYVNGISFETYLRLREKRSAVERELQIVTEAAIRLRGDAEVLCPGQNWRDIRGFGNTLRHAYDLVDGEIIWKIIHDDLPLLKAAVTATLAKLPSGD